MRASKRVYTELTYRMDEICDALNALQVRVTLLEKELKKKKKTAKK